MLQTYRVALFFYIVWELNIFQGFLFHFVSILIQRLSIVDLIPFYLIGGKILWEEMRRGT